MCIELQIFQGEFPLLGIGKTILQEALFLKIVEKTHRYHTIFKSAKMSCKKLIIVLSSGYNNYGSLYQLSCKASLKEFLQAEFFGMRRPLATESMHI